MRSNGFLRRRQMWRNVRQMRESLKNGWSCECFLINYANLIKKQNFPCSKTFEPSNHRRVSETLNLFRQIKFHGSHYYPENHTHKKACLLKLPYKKTPLITVSIIKWKARKLNQIKISFFRKVLNGLRSKHFMAIFFGIHN